MSITFTHDADSVTLRSPELGNIWTTQKYQARGRTADGEPIIEDKGISVQRITVPLRELDATDRSNVDDFFGSAKVNGAVHTFTFTDHRSGAHLVRLMSDVLEWQEYDEGYYGLDLELEVVSESD